MPNAEGYHKSYFQRKKLDPVWYEKHKEKARQKYRDDPEVGKLKSAAHFKENKEAAYAKRKQRRLQNIEAVREKEKAYALANRDSSRKSDAKRRAKKYGLTLEQYLERMQQTDCSICKLPFASTKDRHLDHCHTTAKVRGVLCSRCNLGLGYFKDDPTRLKNAIKYLADNV